MNEIIRNAQSSVTHTSLDPQDWSEFRALAHRMLDDAIDGIVAGETGGLAQPTPIRVALDGSVLRF